MVDSKINDLIKSLSFKCVIGTSSIEVLVPFGSLEQFVNMCIRSGHFVTVISGKSDSVI